MDDDHFARSPATPALHTMLAYC